MLLLVTLFGVGCFVSLFFFFQAEDGIRDLLVTGVQTCALPIWGTGTLIPSVRRLVWAGKHQLGNAAWGASFPSERALPAGGFGSVHTRSEERRVGKECRSRW